MLLVKYMIFMEKIKIRPIKKSDTNNILKWRNNPRVLEHFIYQEKLTKKEHLNWLKTQVKSKKVYQFIIHDNEDLKDIGSIYLRDIDYKNNKAEFGIFIGEDSARGKGMGTLATKEILEFAFKKLKLNKVYLRVFAKNLNAISSYKKSGFVEEGLFKEDIIIKNTKTDLIFMAIFKKDWE
jgi:UDP-4-amino-4,6-dideoxy-N-acetyl-beta-L-altrosamine N-acetyltransferase